MATLLLWMATLFSSPQGATRPDHPDFSGEWILVDSTNPAEGAATALSVEQPIATTTVRGTPMPPAYLELIVARHFLTGVRPARYRIGVEGGTVGGTSAAVHVETRESVTWVGERLVIASSRWSGPPGNLQLNEQRSEVWQLDSEARLVVTTTDQQGQREAQTTLTYRRR